MSTRREFLTKLVGGAAVAVAPPVIAEPIHGMVCLADTTMLWHGVGFYASIFSPVTGRTSIYEYVMQDDDTMKLGRTLPP